MKDNTPAGRCARFFKTQSRDEDRIPLSAWLGMAAFVFVMYLLMDAGAAVGF